MTTPEEILAQVPLFSMLPKKELNRLAREAHDRTFAAGTVLTDEQEVGVTFGVIVAGRARRDDAAVRPGRRVRRLAWRLLFA